MGKPSVSPTTLDVSFVSGDVTSRTVQVAGIDQAVTVSATVLIDKPSQVELKIAQLGVFQEHTIVLDNPDPLPPGFPPLPVQTEQVLIIVNQSFGSPLDVKPGQVIKVNITAQMVSPEFKGATGSLVIVGDIWSPIVIPIKFAFEGSDVVIA